MDAAAIAAWLTALWPIWAAIVAGFVYGIVVWTNTRRDVKDALKLGEDNAKAITLLNTQTQQHAERLVRLETGQQEIRDGIKWMRANWWPRRKGNRN